MADRMVEKVARALCVERTLDPDETDGRGDPTVPGGYESWPRWAEFEKAARAALSASCHEELVEALRPFANFGEGMTRPRMCLHDDMVITQGSSMARRQLTAGDCKAAFAALQKVEATDG